jgi:hypothetical protein
MKVRKSGSRSKKMHRRFVAPLNIHSRAVNSVSCQMCEGCVDHNVVDQHALRNATAVGRIKERKVDCEFGLVSCGIQ